MKKLLLFFLVILLIAIPITGCSNGDPSTAPILNANFKIVDQGDTITIKDDSESDFNNVQYDWTLYFYNEEGHEIYRKSFTGKEFSFPKPNVKKATLQLKLLADGEKETNISEREKDIPTDYIKLMTDLVKEKDLLRVYFSGKANKWLMLNEDGTVIKKKEFEQKVEDVLFDIKDINQDTVILRVFNDGWFLNQARYNFNGETQNHAPVLDPIGDKTVKVNNKLEFTVSATDQDGDNLSYEANNLPNSASFTNKTFTWTPGTKGEYDVTFSVSDGILEDSETITICVEEEIQDSGLTAEFDGQYITVYSEKQAEFIEWTIDGQTLGYNTDSTGHEAQIDIDEFDKVSSGTYDCSIQAYNSVDGKMVAVYDQPTIIEVTK